MKKNTDTKILLSSNGFSICATIAVFLLVESFGDFPERHLLVRLLSTLTLVAFFLSIAQFVCCRSGVQGTTIEKRCQIYKAHNIIGYISTVFLLFHPLFLVVPKILGSGIAPKEAFLTILTTFTSQGIVFGILAWLCMLLLLVTSFSRKRLPMHYTTWRKMHRILALIFIILASLHTVNLSRHATLAMVSFILAMTGVSILPHLKQLVHREIKHTENTQTYKQNGIIN